MVITADVDGLALNTHEFRNDRGLGLFQALRDGPEALGERRILGLLGERSRAVAMAENFNRYEMLGRGDGLRMEAFRRLLPKGVSVVEVPNFDADVHSVADLRAMHSFLFAA